MSKLEETKLLIEGIAKVQELGIDVNGAGILSLLADIAKSLAMISDKLCAEESEDKDTTLSNGQMDILSEIRDDVHRNAEMHEDGDWYLRVEWIDDILDKYKTGSEG